MNFSSAVYVVNKQQSTKTDNISVCLRDKSKNTNCVLLQQLLTDEWKDGLSVVL